MICEWHNVVTQSKFIVSGRNCSICPIFAPLYLVSFRPIYILNFQAFTSCSWRVCTGMPIFAPLSPSVAFFSSPGTDVHHRARTSLLASACATCRHVQDMSMICPRTSLPARACATGKTRWGFLLVPGPWWTSPHTAWAWASSGQRWSPLSCPSWGYHHGCCVPRCYHMSHPPSAHR